MQEYVTVQNEIVMAEEVETYNDYEGVIIVAEKNGTRHVVKREKRRSIDRRNCLKIGTKVVVTNPRGKRRMYESVRLAADALGIHRTLIDQYAQKPPRSGRWVGWTFEKLSVEIW
ncbi:hypothetical protein [Enterococcus sp.]|uniref:hypothetical protein n=1 Tax=Enterococcus sp. TaxID=35783 RepID=UPI003C759C9B